MKLFSINKEAAKFKQELNLPEIPPTENEQGDEATIKYASTLTVKVKAKQQGQLQIHKTWEEKAMYGKYPKSLSPHMSSYWCLIVTTCLSLTI